MLSFLVVVVCFGFPKSTVLLSPSPARSSFYHQPASHKNWDALTVFFLCVFYKAHSRLLWESNKTTKPTNRPTKEVKFVAADAAIGSGPFLGWRRVQQPASQQIQQPHTRLVFCSLPFPRLRDFAELVGAIERMLCSFAPQDLLKRLSLS